MVCKCRRERIRIPADRTKILRYENQNGRGGAIDFVIYLFALSFNDALTLLHERGL
ncbi:protein of unknown function (plasmid) [Caballeronia sp. S22]